MLDHLGRTLDILTSFKADELIGGLVVGLLLAVISAGIYDLTRRRGADAVTSVTLITFGSSLASMVGVTLYLGLGGDGSDGSETVASRVFTVGPPSPRHEPPPRGAPPVWYRGDYPGLGSMGPAPLPSNASEIIRTIDQNQDRRLSPEEAATFVEQVSRTEDGTVGLGELAWSLQMAAAGLRDGKRTPPSVPGPRPSVEESERQSDRAAETSDDGGFARGR